MQVAELLVRNYAVSPKKASLICSQFLDTFRKCPDNYPIDLAIWRKKLWANALSSPYDNLTGKYSLLLI